MVDTLDRQERSRVMAAIRSRGNKATELKLVAILRAHGLKGWRRHQALPGRPDFIFRKERLAVFVDGCFWHGCPEHCRMPKSHLDYWDSKIARNKRRDFEVRTTLEQKGWAVYRIWEHELRQSDQVAARLSQLLSRRHLTETSPRSEPMA